MKKRDFLTLADFSSEEILDMLDEAIRLKQKMDNNEIYTLWLEYLVMKLLRN